MTVPPEHPDPHLSTSGATPVSPRSDPPRKSRWAEITAGTPYHLLARNSVHRWWRPLVTILLFVVLAVAALFLATVVHLVLYLVSSPRVLLEFLVGSPSRMSNPFLQPLVVMLFSFALLAALIPAVLFTVWWAQRRSFGSVVGVAGRMRWHWLGECLLYGLLVFGVMFAIGLVLQLFTGVSPWQGFPGWRAYVAIATIALVVVPFQASAEEFVFRGLLVQTLTAWWRTPWVAMIVSSLLFLSAHGYTDPLVWFELLFMAMTMCWLSIRTGGLEAAVGLHVGNNSLSLLVGGLSGVPSMQQAGDYTVMQVLPLIVAILGYAWIVDRRAARRGVDTVVGGRIRIAPLALRPVERKGRDLSTRTAG